MTTSFSHSATIKATPAAVYAAYSSEEYWQDRVANVGAPEDHVDEFSAGDDGVRVVVTHAIPDSEIPDAAKKVLRGGLVIRRTTTYDPFDGERITGSAHAEAAGGLGLIDGSGEATSVAADTVVESVSGTVKVSVPLLGGRLEKMVVDYLDKLFTAEYAHLDAWVSKA